MKYCERAKIKLSDEQKITIKLSSLFEGKDLELEITRTDFE